MKNKLEEILRLSNLETIESSGEMQDNLEKINKLAQELIDEITYSD
jgi:hypothetical protein